MYKNKLFYKAANMKNILCSFIKQLILVTKQYNTLEDYLAASIITKHSIIDREGEKKHNLHTMA